MVNLKIFTPIRFFFFGGGGQLDKKGVGVAFRRAIVILISIFLTYVTNKIMTVLIWALFFNLNVSQNLVCLKFSQIIVNKKMFQNCRYF